MNAQGKRKSREITCLLLLAAARGDTRPLNYLYEILINRDEKSEGAGVALRLTQDLSVPFGQCSDFDDELL